MPRRFWQNHVKRNYPIVDDDFNLKGLITIKDIEKQIKYPLAAKDEQGRLLCGAAVGITSNVLARVEALVKANVDVIVIDSAHGHSENIFEKQSARSRQHIRSCRLSQVMLQQELLRQRL